MADGVNIKVSGPALKDVRDLLKKVDDREAAMRVVGRVAANAYRRHFLGLNQKHPNKLGGKRTGFWRAVSKSVSVVSATKTRAVIGIGHPAIAHKVYGGTITPKRTKYLAIPVDATAHGIGAKEYPAATALRIYAGGLLIVRKADGKPLYALKKSVTHAAQPDALPDIRGLAPEIAEALRASFGVS